MVAVALKSISDFAVTDKSEIERYGLNAVCTHLGKSMCLLQITCMCMHEAAAIL